MPLLKIGEIPPALTAISGYANGKPRRSVNREHASLGTVEEPGRMDVDTKLAANHSRRSGNKHKQELAVADEPCVFSHSSHLLSSF